jgi:hypothetical protein
MIAGRRTLGLLFLLLLSMWTTAFAGSSTGTADYVQANAAKLDGMSHSIYVRSADPSRVEGKTQWFNCATVGQEGRSGGWILVRIPTERAGEFLRMYETTKRAEVRLDGVVRLKSGYAYMDAWGAESIAAVEGPSGADYGSNVRTWTSVDGRQIEAEFLSSTTTHVKFRRVSDGQVFDYELAKLSQADRDWVTRHRRAD